MYFAKLLPFLVLSVSLGCAQERAPEDYPDAVTADPSHYTVEFENDAVRLLRVQYGSEEESVMHYHPALCSVGLDASMWQMTAPDGAETQDTVAFGEVQCVEAGAHMPENIGPDAAEVVLIEFKSGAMAGSATWNYPDAVTADPDHYSVEFNNDVARVLRIRYAAGETSVMHYHPAHCGVWLLAQPGTMEGPTGEIQESAAMTRGDVQCNDATVHLPTNTGAGQSELVLLELKGRQAFRN